MHFERDIKNLTRIDKSYAELGNFNLGHFQNIHKEINLSLIGLPFKSIEELPSHSKTEYNDILYRQEDDRYKQDSEI